MTALTCCSLLGLLCCGFAGCFCSSVDSSLELSLGFYAELSAGLDLGSGMILVYYCCAYIIRICGFVNSIYILLR